jgi:hypothetical protein
VDLLSAQNDRYEEELRVQDTQERMFTGHRIGIEEELAILFSEEDAIVKRMEGYAIDIRAVSEKKSQLKEYVMRQKEEERDVSTGIYNLHAAKQHIGILQHRLTVALDQVNHFIDGGVRARARIDELRRLRVLADHKLTGSETSLARAEVQLKQQERCTAAAADMLRQVRFEVRKVQERVLAEKMEFDSAVAEFRAQFLSSQDRINQRNARPAASKLQAHRAKSDDPLHTIGEVTLEEEVAMTRRLRDLEEESEHIATEARLLQRSTMRARHLLAEIQREFDVPLDMSFSSTPAPLLRTATQNSALTGAVRPFSRMRRVADAQKPSARQQPQPPPRAHRPPQAPSSPARPPTLALRSQTSPPHSRVEAPPLSAWGGARTSILGGQEERSAQISEFIVSTFNSAEDAHVGLTRQITQKELEVQAAERELAEARRGNAKYAPGNEYDMRRQACSKAEKLRDAFRDEHCAIQGQTAEIDGVLRAAARRLEAMGETLAVDMSALVSPLDKLHSVCDCFDRLAQVSDLEARNLAAMQRPPAISTSFAPRGRFSSLVVSADTSGIDQFAMPTAANSQLRRKAAAVMGRAGQTGRATSKKLTPISTAGAATSGSVFVEEGAKTGSRKIVIRPNTLRPAKLASRLAEPDWLTGVRPMSRAELERESVRALLPRRALALAVAKASPRKAFPM